ncbi:MAG TPA: UrcA family protein [Caulobacteraceae bacterium]|jgi:UrcA family protein|nr:UrcA family protein [Caulobacteraceae bacterium]
MKTIIIAALGLASIAGAASASDALAVDHTVVRVGYDASSVATPRAAENFLDRLSSAALEACGAFPGSFPDYRWAVKRSNCYHQKLSQAVSQVDSPILSKIYEDRAPSTSGSGGEGF